MSSILTTRGENNLQYSFDELLKDLEIGREIEFEYHMQQCAIVNSNGKWFFCIDSKSEELCNFEEKDVLIHKVRMMKVDGDNLESIIDNNLYSQGTLYIL